MTPNPICPFAVQHILHGEEDRRPTILPVATALHTAVTRANGLQLGAYFDRETVVNDSTFYVDVDGGLYQFGPVNRKANAQFSGNAWRNSAGTWLGAVSIETWDGGNPATPLNPAQITTLIRLYVWLHAEWSISLDVSDRWNGPGAGWHSKYPEWNRNSHACPGQVRVRQLLEDVLPAARTGSTTAPVPPKAPLPQPIVTSYPEEHVKSIDLTIDTDANGKGYRDLPDVPARTVVNVMANTGNPTDGGYKPIPDVARIALGKGCRVVIEEAVPNGRIDVTVWVAA